MQIEVKQTGIISNKLALIKMIKSHTQWGLKQAKDWVDNFSFGKSQSLDVLDPIKFERELEEIGGVKSYSTSQKRQRKLISIGLGDMEDKIDFLSQELTDDLAKNYGCAYSDYLRFFTDLLIDMDENSINTLVSRFLTK